MTVETASSKPEFKSGITWRSILAILFSSLLFLPVSIYLQLVGGAQMAVAAAFMTIILFSEISRIFRSELSKQEFCIIYEMTALAASATIYLWTVYKAYFVNSLVARSFTIGNVPLPDLIPSWWAPPIGSEAYLRRTLFHIDWLIPHLLANLQGGIFFYLEEFALTMIVSHIYIESEKLPFPWANLDSSMIITLSQRNSSSLKYFLLSIYPGITWGALLYTIPILTGITFIPLPWVDLSPYTENYLPGALMGIMTDIAPIVLGFLISFSTALCMLIGSVATWIIGNALTLTTFSRYFHQWSLEYYYGMSIANCWQRSLLRVWIMPQIGFSIGLAAYLLAKGYKYIVASFKSLARISQEEKSSKGFPSLKLLIAMYVFGTVGSVITFHMIVPDFPIWIPALLSIGLSFLNALVTTRALGETAYSISIPYIWESAVTFVGYRKLDAWLFPPVIGGTYTIEGGAPSWTQMVKVAYLTETRPIDIIKALTITILVYSFFSIIYVDFFWRMAPIPSAIYPMAMIQWPIQVINQSVWITGGIGTNFITVIESGALMIGVCVLGDLLTKSFGIPFSATALVTGFFNIPPYAIPVFIGSILGRFVFPRVFKDWDKNKSIIAAGIWCGEGIIVGISVAGALISKATWIWPW